MLNKMTNNQICAINADGFVLTSASAGSGKTAVLVERALRLLKDEVNIVDADKLLIVTFTKAAALEMKDKIFKRLNLEIASTKNQRLIKQLQLLPNAQISTIDAFCAFIAREYFLELDISYDFIQPEQHVLDEILYKAINQIINEYYESEDANFILLCDNFKMNFDDGELVETIFRLCDFLFSQPNPERWLEEKILILDKPDYIDKLFIEEFSYVKKILLKYETILKKAIKISSANEELNKRYTAFFEKNLYHSDFLLKQAANFSWDVIYKYLNEISIGKLPSKSTSEIKFLWDESKKIILSLKKIFEANKEDNIKQIKRHNIFAKIILEITKKSLQKNNEIKKVEKYMSYSDISFAVLRLLTDEKLQSASSIISRYSAVLIDEYQDINDLQNMLFYELTKKFSSAFIVGDAKQSIYGFRDSNPQNFIDYFKKLPDYTENSVKSRITLNNNFRSKKNICEFINIIFSKIMSEQVGDIEYTKNEELVSAKSFSSDNYPDIELKLANMSSESDENSTDEESDKKSSAECESIIIANTIIDLINREPFLNGEAGLRKAEYGDIAILLRSRNHIDIFISTLKKYNIPTIAKTNVNFLQCMEIKTIISLLKVIINPKNEIALAAVLYSPLYNFSADELAELKLNINSNELFDAVKKSNSLKCKKFITDLKNFIDLSFKYTCFELISYLVEYTNFIYTILSMDDGIRRKNNLLLLLEYAKKFSTLGENKLYFFVKYLERMEESNSIIKSSDNLVSKTNCVKIMTIHNSKGLQFPICIVGSLDGGFNNEHVKQILTKDKEMGIGIKLYDKSKNLFNTTLHKRISDRKTIKKLLSEEMRLFYVALTRSEEKIILTGTSKNFYETLDKLSLRLILNNQPSAVDADLVALSNNYLEWIMLSLLKNYDISYDNIDYAVEIINKHNLINIEIINKQALQVIDKDEDKYIIDEININAKLYEETMSNLSYKYKYDYLNNIYTKLSASQLKAEEINIESFNNKSPIFTKEKMSPAEIGIAHHEFLQFCDFNKAKENISSEKQRLLENNFMRKNQIDSLNDETLTQFFNSDLYNRTINSDYFIREKRFMIESTADKMNLNTDERVKSEPIIIQGVIDLVFVEDGKAVIVDYKTDRINDESKFIEYYSNQLYIYKLAIGQIYNLDVKNCYIYSLHLHKEISMYAAELLL